MTRIIIIIIIMELYNLVLNKTVVYEAIQPSSEQNCCVWNKTT